MKKYISLLFISFLLNSCHTYKHTKSENKILLRIETTEMHDGKVILCRIFNDSEDTLNYNLNPRNFRLYLKQKSLRHPLYLNMNYRLPSEFSIPSKGTAIIFSEKIEKLFNNKDCFWDWEAASQPPLFNSSNDFKKDTVSMWFSINFDEKQFKSDKILVKIR